MVLEEEEEEEERGRERECFARWVVVGDALEALEERLWRTTVLPAVARVARSSVGSAEEAEAAAASIR